MDFGLVVILALLWGVINLLGQAQKKGRQGNIPRPGPGRRPVSQRSPAKRPGTFEELLAEMRAQLEAAKQAEEREALGLPGAEEVEERESLEITPVVGSRELPAPATSREVVDFDVDAEAVAQRRVAEAEARNRAWRAADHKAFDTRIRTRKAKEVSPSHVSNLRQALIWSEVLGKPVSLRDGEG